MDRFTHGEVDLLVATTVIEVGVDVPNASLMIHRERGTAGLGAAASIERTGRRGTRKSVCLVMYHSPLSELARKD